MFGPPGHAYVYRSYGIHWCLNLVCEEEGVAERGARPRARARRTGSKRMRERRGIGNHGCSAAGPGRLCQALGVTREHDGLPLDRPPFELSRPRASRRGRRAAPRIGITRAAERPWRYALAGSRVRQPRFTQSLTGSPGAGGHPAFGRWRTILRPRARARRSSASAARAARRACRQPQPDHASGPRRGAASAKTMRHAVVRGQPPAGRDLLDDHVRARCPGGAGL